MYHHADEREEIIAWFDEQTNRRALKCPMTGQSLASDTVYPNIALRRSIEEFCEKESIVLPEVAPREPAVVAEGSAYTLRQRGQYNDNNGGGGNNNSEGGNTNSNVSIGFGYLPSLFGLVLQDWRLSVAHEDEESLQVSGGHRVVSLIATVLILGVILF